jgi:hypothetical protein
MRPFHPLDFAMLAATMPAASLGVMLSHSYAVGVCAWLLLLRNASKLRRRELRASSSTH